MKNIVNFIFLLFLFVLSPLVNAQPIQIKFATEATYPPFVYIGKDGQIKGFDADIIYALCKKLHATCSLSNQPWQSLIPSLKLGKFDALFGGMAITDAREKQVNFTHAYYNNSVSVVAPKSAQLSLSVAGLKNKVIGVQGGTTFDVYLQNTYGSVITINRYPSMQDAFLDLQSGRVDAVIGDTPVIQQWLEKNASHYTLVGKPIQNITYFGKGNGIAVKKGNTKLLKALNKALQAIKNDGTYQKILNKHFSNT